MIEIIANDRLGRKVRVKCSPTDTVGDLKKLIAAQIGTNASKIQLKKWYTVFKDHIELRDYEIHDGMSGAHKHMCVEIGSSETEVVISRHGRGMGLEGLSKIGGITKRLVHHVEAQGRYESHGFRLYFVWPVQNIMSGLKPPSDLRSVLFWFTPGHEPTQVDEVRM
ncbi:hypothetical protein QFC21_006714 [Naganishia friedmannii]|uniref:Uncharacterized protein n=1 Tax=Naganishia friedmannii TaxID=89922 RepID=A0ACC2UZX7_9TREE|nr:hypothetical protein QFC21_006714 [Naganishia friedmannii]